MNNYINQAIGKLNGINNSQVITSACTSINANKLPALYGKLNWELIINDLKKEGEKLKLLDIGCGRYTMGIKLLCKKMDVEYFPYDPYNQDKDTNIASLNCNPDLVVSANCLNVIDSEEERDFVHSLIKSYDVPYFITVYEGNKSGISKVTKKTNGGSYQTNYKTADYLMEDELALNSVITKPENKKYITGGRK